MDEDPKQKTPVQLVKLNRALKLAEQWVNNMSNFLTEDDPESVELEGRPSRLGIGVVAQKESRVSHSGTSIERKLFSKLQADKRKSINRDANSAPTLTNNGKVDDNSSDEEEPESKTQAFSKKRPSSFASPLKSKKRGS